MDYIAELRDLAAQRAELDAGIDLRLLAGRAAGVPVQDLADAAGIKTRQTVYTRSGGSAEVRGATRAVIEVDGSRTKVADVLSRELGRSVQPSQAGRLGWEVVVDVAEAVAAVEALRSAGLTVEVRFEK